MENRGLGLAVELSMDWRRARLRGLAFDVSAFLMSCFFVLHTLLRRQQVHGDSKQAGRRAINWVDYNEWMSNLSGKVDMSAKRK